MKLFDSFKTNKDGETESNNLGCSMGLALFLAGPSLIVAIFNFIHDPAKYWYTLLLALILVFILCVLFYRISTRSIFKRAQYKDATKEELIEGNYEDVTNNQSPVEDSKKELPPSNDL